MNLVNRLSIALYHYVITHLVTGGRVPAAPPPGLPLAVVTLMLLQLLSTEIFRG